MRYNGTAGGARPWRRCPARAGGASIVLVLALLHGLDGMRWVIEDHVHSRGWRTFSMAALWTIGFLFMALGSLVLFTFTPVARPA